jgi:hypothetical protein
MGPELLALLAEHAEAVPRRRFHDPPALDERDALRTERFEALHLGFDVVGLDVEVHAAFVRDFLDHHDRLVFGGLDLGVAVLAVEIDVCDLAADRRAPELRGGFEIFGISVDDDRAESAVIHCVSY